MAKAVIGIGTLFALHRITDASKMYHSVRGQETIKLYVIFNVLEVRPPRLLHLLELCLISGGNRLQIDCVVRSVKTCKTLCSLVRRLVGERMGAILIFV